MLYMFGIFLIIVLLVLSSAHVLITMRVCKTLVIAEVQVVVVSNQRVLVGV